MELRPGAQREKPPFKERSLLNNPGSYVQQEPRQSSPPHNSIICSSALASERWRRSLTAGRPALMIEL